MWIRVRTMDGKRSEQVDGLSKLTKIEDLRELIMEKFSVEPSLQRLFFRGKQLEDGYSLFDYDVGLNALVQLLERKVIKEVETQQENETPASPSDTDSGIETAENVQEVVEDTPSTSCEGLYKINALIDAQDTDVGAWFEAKVVNVTKGKTDGLDYHIKFDDYGDDGVKVVGEKLIRPRARKLLEWNEIEVTSKVMANYNMDHPKERGFWYDCVVLDKKNKRKKNELTVQLLLGENRTLEPCNITFVEEVFVIETVGSESGPLSADTAVTRKTEKEADCGHCRDNPDKDCKECGCHVCGEKRAFDKTLLCDECNLPFHTFCLNPPLDNLPEEDDWYCPLCCQDRSKVVKAGEKLKENKKKNKMKSMTSDTQRDWGKGMACVGRSKICTIVPSNHFGAIPGVPVGSLWKFRVQVSESGIHRPHVSGIHGKENEGAYSIVLAGGYEDDEDNGDEFTYTGSGGRDLSGNKRTAEQSCDQVLTKNNMAIARTCDVKADAKNGAEAKDWKKSRPIRVVRNYKGAKHSDYAPEEGNRYDGLYKVVKYWPEKGKSGFIVWRYLFRRDDKEPAPWTKAGKKRSKELGITIKYPEGYLEAQAQKLANEEAAGPKKKGKRSLSNDDASTPKSTPKKIKINEFEVSQELMKMIKTDKLNSKLWSEGLKSRKEGQTKFYQIIQDLFMCVCCQDVVHQPITTPCKHNLCKTCLQRSFKADIYSCPVCREDLEKENIEINIPLQKVLLKLFPGYTSGR
uniref:RING-type E3 ubiquitin transferase n=1 Tax=Ciona intestinalis TaxID=7719 RepID=Q4H2N4_CIOIN|nr:UHRF2 protein [Ciona intestinalis]BAE06743.1 Ci-UHRF2 [Ciona intestinalis]|eukprot:NP_001071846.1 UHRF2 protein [Ciona intestinalis]